MEIWEALGQGLSLLLEPHRMMLLWGGVLCGLALGILPGIGGVAGTALLLPFTYNMDPAAAMALLLGLAATTTHGDPISAIVLGAGQAGPAIAASRISGRASKPRRLARPVRESLFASWTADSSSSTTCAMSRNVSRSSSDTVRGRRSMMQSVPTRAPWTARRGPC